MTAEVTRLTTIPARPKPDERAIIPHPEDWAAWCQHPITRFVATAMARAAEQQREAWFAQSWTGGDANPDVLRELRTRADAYMAFLETDLESYVEIFKA